VVISMFLTISFFQPIQPWLDWTGEEIAENTVAVAPFGVLSYLDLLCDPSFEERADSKCTFLVQPSSPCLLPPLHNRSEREQNNIHHHSISLCSTLSLGFIQISISAVDSVTNFRQGLQAYNTLIPSRCLDGGCSTAAR